MRKANTILQILSCLSPESEAVRPFTFVPCDPAGPLDWITGSPLRNFILVSMNSQQSFSFVPTPGICEGLL